MDKTRTFCIFGGSQDSGNLGVSALGAATIQNLVRYYPGCRILLQQQGSLPKRVEIPAASGSINVTSIFLHTADRFRERHGTKLVRTFARASNYLPAFLLNTLDTGVFAKIMETDVFLDVSGGDSFSSTYGERVFRAMLSFKQIPLILGKPLILLPQTFGPFHGESVHTEVAGVMRKCGVITSRDAGGLDELKDILGDLDKRFMLCPDVAFTLASTPLSSGNDLFLRNSDSRPLLGLNISGLLYADRKDFGISLNYRELMKEIITWFVQGVGGRVVLVPHVVEKSKKTPGSGIAMEDTDEFVCNTILPQLTERLSPHVSVLKGSYNPCEIKYLIGTCDFFIGARMHACIAATSQGVPTVALAYSKKFDGVFELAGMPGIVHDLRTGTIENCLAKVAAVYLNRERVRNQLESAMKDTLMRIESYFDTALRPHLSC